ncbi:Tyrosine phosphatase family, putative [Leishmania lindenbergi]|uniref:protein-tyrosine-phosphatase n=1 Tax=Leishmania lindenbergi TaxID=651832 RepID=A0AAW3AEH4_9TRYP
MKVIPPNFGYVEEGIFRCGAPEPRHYGFLSSLGLRTCILLTDIHDDAFVQWLQESGVTIFCPLASELQTCGTFRGVAHEYTPLPAPDGVAGGNAAAASSSRPAIVDGSKGGNAKEVGREGTTRNSRGVDGTYTHFDSPGNGNARQVEGDGWTDGNGEGIEEDRGFSTGGRSWVAMSSGTATASTSNAVRFLQENVGERQMSPKLSPVHIPAPLYFPINGLHYNGGGDSGVEAAVPSYEGKLHGLMTLSEAVVVSILHILLDPLYYPLLITCSKGRYRSGIVCGCLRKLQGWNLVSILEEYRRFAGNKSRADNEEFIELFDEELVSLELSDGRRPTILYNS